MDLRIKDIVDLLKVSENTVREWIDSNKIPHYKVKNQYYFSKSEINEWILNNRVEVSDKILDIRFTSTPVIIEDLIKKGGIHYNLSGKNASDLITKAIKIIPVPKDITREEIVNSLLERESMMTTAVGKGIAFPHPRNPVTADADSEQISVCLLKEPVDFGALDGIPVHTLFIIISSSPKRHLEILSKLSYLCQQEEFVKVIKNKSGKDTILKLAKTIENGWDRR
jgi:nitrogen PTS system EIIA component